MENTSEIEKHVHIESKLQITARKQTNKQKPDLPILKKW